MKFNDLFVILWSRRWIVLAILVITVATTAIASLIMPKQYTATSTVVLDVQSPDRIVGMVLPGMMSPAYMATQMDIVKSERVAQRVVQLLRMDENAEIRRQWREATAGQGSVAQWMAPFLMKKLDVRPSRESHVIEIKFTGPNALYAAAAANGFAQAYIDTTIELRAEPARKYAAWFETQFDVHRRQLEAAQGKLSDLQRRTGIVATDERLDFESRKLGELIAQLSMAEAEGTDSASKRGLVGGVDTLPEVMRNPMIVQLKTEIVRLESRLQEMSGEMGENHPRVRSTIAELDEMNKRLQQETRNLAASISTLGDVSQAKVEELKVSIEAQKQTMFEMRNQKDQIRLLSQEVDAAQRAFDAISLRLTQSQLEAQTVQTNVSVLTPAIPPLQHSKPLFWINLFIAVFMGSLLAVGICLIMELIKPVVRSRESLSAVLGVPVLAEFEWVQLNASVRRSRKSKSSVKAEEA